jgi:GNAT superfamily N-acetyltransferase
MPAIMDDPDSPTIYRVSGPTPYPEPGKPEFSNTIRPRQVMLRDRQTIATVVPLASAHQLPPSLLKYLSDQFAKEIEGGDTYPMVEPMPLERYAAYWFQNFAAIMLLGTIDSAEQVVEGKDWSKECLGSFYIKPNYPGRSSHVCNAGFLVTDAARNRGVGRLMGESYLDWAPKLGYTYSVFNLVYETNVASCKIWDGLGFKRIGRVKGCGNLKSYPDRLVDAIIFGRDLGEAAGDGADGPVSEERFDKIKFYLKYGKYPNGSDRAEKSRLRSAATHYKLLENDVLMLKDKEVISDPVRQINIARRVHEAGNHAGINKTTATIAERYHWSRIKETVSDVIRLCSECKELGKVPLPGNAARRAMPNNHVPDDAAAPVLVPDPKPGPVESMDSVLGLREPPPAKPSIDPSASHYETHSDLSLLLNPMHPLEEPHNSHVHASELMLQEPPSHMVQGHRPHHATASMSVINTANMYSPIDPQIISDASHHGQHDDFATFHELTRHHDAHHSPASLPGHDPYDPPMPAHRHAVEPDDFHQLQVLLHGTGSPEGLAGHMDHGTGPEIQEDTTAFHSHVDRREKDDDDAAAMDRDIDMMLLEHHGGDSDSDDMANLRDALVLGQHGDKDQDERETSSEKRDRRNTTGSEENNRSPKRRLWDNVVFGVP